MRFPFGDIDNDPAGGRWRAAVGPAISLLLMAVAGCATGPDKQETGAEQAAETPETTDEQKAADEADKETGKTTAKSPEKMKVPEGEAHPRIKRGVEAAANGNYSRAKNVLSGMTDSEEFGHIAEYDLAVIAEIEGKPGDAARLYSQALEKNPDFTAALMNLVRVYLRQGRVDDGARVARKYINQRPENLDHRAAMLEVNINRGQYQQVVREAKSILRRDERNVEAMVAMAKANYWMERYELTKAILARASDLAPERADIYFVFGLVAMANDKNGRAIANLKKAIQYNGRFAEAYNNLGLLYDEAGDYEGAVEQFKAAIAHYPEFKEAILNLGNAYKGLGKLKEAEQQFKKVLELDSENANAYFNLGALYLDAKIPGMKKIPRLQKAIEMLNNYKRVSRGQVPEDDPADEYMKAAREKIRVEKKRRKMMRQMQKGKSGGGS